MSLLRNYLPVGPLVLDASAIINILGCGFTDEVFRGLSRECIIEERALEELRRHPVPGQSHTAVVADLQNAGLLRVERMTDAEYLAYLDLIQGALSSRLGSGESASIATAVSRGYAIVLDDGKARRVFGARLDKTPCISTLKLLFSVAFLMGWGHSRLADAVASARAHARLGVPKEDRDLLSYLSL